MEGTCTSLHGAQGDVEARAGATKAVGLQPDTMWAQRHQRGQRQRLLHQPGPEQALGKSWCLTWRSSLRFHHQLP